MKALNIINVILAVGLISIFTMSNKEPKQEESMALEDSNSRNGYLPQIIKSVSISSDINFAGESMPQTQINLERLDRELTVNSYWHSNTILGLKRAKKYFPIIDQILLEEGVPLDFKYIAVAESNLENLTSPAGAKGFWQIMPTVGTHYGLLSNTYVEERFNIEKATRVACKLIKAYKNRFGNWTNAAAAYNMGEGNFNKELNSQKEQSYYDMNFGHETNRYLFRILALKEIHENPEKFGFYLDEEDYYFYPKYSIIQVEKNIDNLGDFAHQYGVTYKELKELNPWLKTNKLIVSGSNTFTVKIPRS